MNKFLPKVLTIGGVDPSGGAGIEADIKTLTSLRVYALSIPTSLTIQNTKGVFEKFNISPEIIEKQLKYILEDIEIKYVKISMIGDIKNIITFKKMLSDKFIIFDPVLYSKNGFPLIDEENLKLIEEELIPLCKIITPNFHELKILSKIEDDYNIMAKKILENHINLKALILKGGHIDENKTKIFDRLFIKEKEKINSYTFTHSRINSTNLHGTGCTLASAISAYLAKNNEIKKATHKGIKYIYKLIKKSKDYKVGKGNGPLIHFLF